MKKFSVERALRLSLGAMYLYSGINIVRHPNAWTWVIKQLPPLIQNPITQFGAEKYLLSQGVGEIILALIFLIWFLPRSIVKYAGLFSAFEMLAIILLVGVDAVTFRDIGLIGPGLALFLML